MKLSLFFIFLNLMSLYAVGYGQNSELSITKSDATIKEVLSAIESQSSYKFLYRDSDIENQLVSIDYSSTDIHELLNSFLPQIGSTFQILPNNLVVIMPDDYMQSVVTGRITDINTGETLVGANISIEGTTIGTVTDLSGNYSIEVPNEGDIILFSFVGYLTQQVEYTGQKTLDIALMPDIASLEEVVVIGYGIQKKRDLTGAISQIKAEDMENRSLARAEQALQGKTAGVNIISTSGAPGKPSTVRIRGFSSNTSSDPLYVVDGVRTSDISNVDPSNIETMEVLKDAASAAIYGAEAGNGVVLITTKKGEKGTGKITYDFQYVVNSLAYVPEVMNSQQYADYFMEAYPLSLDETTIGQYWDGINSTDWMDVAFEKSIMKKHSLSFSGGNERGTYISSINWLDQDGLIKGSKDIYRRLNFMFNADYKINDYLKVGTNNILEKSLTRELPEGAEGSFSSLLSAVLTLDPWTHDIYAPNELPAHMASNVAAGRVYLTDENGNYYGVGNFTEMDNVHPMIMRDRSDEDNNSGSIIGKVFGELTPVKGLVITSNFGYNASIGNDHLWEPVYYANNITNNNVMNVEQSTENSIGYQWENYANYTFSIGRNNINVMGGMSYRWEKNYEISGDGNDIYKTDSPFRELDYLTPTAADNVEGNNSEFAFISYFGRVFYNYGDKYLFNASLRRDSGNESQLPSNNLWGIFPAVSGAWTISNEDFFPKDLKIDFMKLRVSWGQNGSIRPLRDFAYRTSVNFTNNYPYTNAIDYTLAAYPRNVTNNNLKWETSEQLDFGIDIRLFDNRLSLTVDYYDKKTKDLLVRVTPPYEVGLSDYTVNAGDVSNKGFEFEFGWNDRIGDLSYNIRPNLATLKNEVTYLDRSLTRIPGSGVHTHTVTVFEEGYPVWYMRGYHFLDIDNATGDPIFEDVMPDGVINDDDMINMGSGIPNVTYGLTINAEYKGIDLTVFGTGSIGNKVFLGLQRVDRPRSNKLTIFYDERWTTNNPTASRPRPISNGESQYWYSDALVFDGTFFKIKQIQLGYTLPKQLTQKLFISKLRVYASLDDWFVFTKYPGFDPEASAGSSQYLGIDSGAYPTSRKMTLGLNVTF